MVGCHHALGVSGVSQDSVVREANMGHVEVDQLGVVVAEGNREAQFLQGLVEPSVTPIMGLVGNNWS